jgi:hypothetical protein
VDAIINTGCVLYKEGNYEAAAAKFKDAAAAEGSQVGADNAPKTTQHTAANWPPQACRCTARLLPASWVDFIGKAQLLVSSKQHR